jgi:hypothetical protein
MEETNPAPDESGRPRGPARDPRVRVAAVVVVAVLAGLGVWLAVRDDGSKAPATAAVGVSESNLRALVGAAAGSVYWAGPKAGVTYELTQTPDSRTYVRYLPKGVPVGTAAPYLTIGTYPVANAFAVTSDAAKQPGMVAIRTGNGAVAFYAKSRPTNVYMAFPGSSSQIEIYDPAPASVRQLVTADGISALDLARPATTTTAAAGAAATRVTVDDLKKLPAALGSPVYWLGPLGGKKYELTRTPDGRVYVRYLPVRAPIGATTPYLTVATYPLAHAFAATRAAGRRPGTVLTTFPGGVVAFYSRAKPTSVYVAFPGVDEQIEIFDPSPQRNPFAVAKRVSAVS